MTFEEDLAEVRRQARLVESDQRRLLPERLSARVMSILTTAAALGAPVDALLPAPPAVKEVTAGDLDRIRKAQEKRERRAAKRAKESR